MTDTSILPSNADARKEIDPSRDLLRDAYFVRSHRETRTNSGSDTVFMEWLRSGRGISAVYYARNILMLDICTKSNIYTFGVHKKVD